MAEYGSDIVLAAGGGLMGHPQGGRAGAAALRQAVDAAMADQDLEEAAKSHTELKAALDQWSMSERPSTP